MPYLPLAVLMSDLNSLDKSLNLRLPQAIEVGVGQALKCRVALLGVHPKHSLHEVECLLRQFANIPLLQGLWLGDRLRKLVAYEARIGLELLLLIGSQLTQDLTAVMILEISYLLDAKQLVNFRFSRKEGLAVCELAKDAANGPDVNLLPVVVAQKELWSSVPSGGYVVCETAWVLVVKDARESEIAYAKLVRLPSDSCKALGLRIDEKVLRLDVSVYYVRLMTEFDCLQKLVYVLAHSLRL